jgi:hypothetical protein
LLGIVGGVIAAVLISVLGGSVGEQRNVEARITTGHSPSNHPGISIHHIPVEGAAGLLFVFGTVVIFAGGIPAVGDILMITVPLGVVALGILHYWHKRHPVKIEALDLHKH